ncbi:hypothetical protein Scep_027866 [Stephania cephalantha]|uniref:RING-type domain-containing protein n=1 Tax=Stephania cephalantha TaxID=152367 RepID=A0AAP0HIY1_9MAGN
MFGVRCSRSEAQIVRDFRAEPVGNAHGLRIEHLSGTTTASTTTTTLRASPTDMAHSKAVVTRDETGSGSSGVPMVVVVGVVVVEATEGPNSLETPEATEGAEAGEAPNPPEMKKSKKKTHYENESPMVLQEVPRPMIIKTSVFNLLKTDISSLACSLARLDVRMGKLVWPITLDVRVTSSIPYEDFDFDYELEEPFEDLEEETIFRIVPAKRSSVEALDKIEFLGQGVDAGKDCAICLGEFEIGSELTCMPSLHAFHAECIVEWLERSDQCPLCQSKPPT